MLLRKWKFLFSSCVLHFSICVFLPLLFISLFLFSCAVHSNLFLSVCVFLFLRSSCTSSERLSFDRNREATTNLSRFLYLFNLFIHFGAKCTFFLAIEWFIPLRAAHTKSKIFVPIEIVWTFHRLEFIFEVAKEQEATKKTRAKIYFHGFASENCNQKRRRIFSILSICDALYISKTYRTRKGNDLKFSCRKTHHKTKKKWKLTSTPPFHM